MTRSIKEVYFTMLSVLRRKLGNTGTAQAFSRFASRKSRAPARSGGGRHGKPGPIEGIRLRFTRAKASAAEEVPDAAKFLREVAEEAAEAESVQASVREMCWNHDGPRQFSRSVK